MPLGNVTQITFEPGLEIEPAISPDGKLVAYAAGPLSATRIYVRQAGGSTLEDHTLNILVRLETRADGTRVFKELKLVRWHSLIETARTTTD